MSDTESSGEFPVESFLNRAVTEVRFIEPHIARFKYVLEPIIPDVVRVLIEGITPDAPKRSAVEYNHKTSTRQLRKVFDSYGDWPTQAGFDTWNRLLEFNVRHIYRPDFIYTNGQSVVTRIDRDGSVELVAHNRGDGIRAFLGLDSIAVHDFTFDAEGLTQTDSEESAEDAIRETLEAVEALQLTATDGTREVPATFLPVVYGFAGYVAKVGDRKHLMNRGHSDFLAIQLREIPKHFDGFYPKCCGPCTNLRMSGMSMDMSQGSMGYCESRMRSREDDRFKPDDVVHVMDICDSYSPREV